MRMYNDLKEDIDNGMTLRQTIIGFAPAIGGKLNRKNELVPRNEINKKLKELKKELTRISRLSLAEAEAEQKLAYEKEVREYDLLVIKNERLRTKYMNIITQVENWDVSSNPKIGEQLQYIALYDLKTSMNADCYIPKATPTLYSGEEWQKNAMESLNLMINDYQEVWDEEKKTVKAINELINLNN